MDRKSIILCLSILAVLVLGTGIAVAFLYSDVDSDRDRKTTGTVDPEKDRLFAAIPSDAVLVACFSEEGLLDSGMAVSLHYSGKLLPLYVYEAGAPSVEPSEDASRLMESLTAKGMTARYAVSEKALVVASPSEVLVQSSLRHLDKSMSVMDAPGFADACSLISGDDVLLVSNIHASYLMPAVFTKKYTSYSGFVSRLSDWTALDISRSDDSFRMAGSALYDEDASEFMTVLNSSDPAVSAVSSVLPSYTVFAASLPLGKPGSYIDGYDAFLDSRQSLQKNNAERKALASKAGMSPQEFVAVSEMSEVATASFMAGGKLEKVVLMKVGRNLPESLSEGNAWPYAGFAASLFGNVFKLEDESAFARLDGWLVSGSPAAIDEYVSGRALEYTLKQYMADAGQPDLLAARKSSFVSYFSFSEDFKILDGVFKTAFLDMTAPVYEGAEYCPMVVSVAPGKDSPSIKADILRLRLEKTKAPAFERDTTVTVPAGPFEVKNSGTGKMNRFYQNSHLALCLSEDGKDLWGVPFKEKLCGTAHNVDYYANGKLQILFGAGSKLYLIDRLGRYVTGFPVDLKKDILLGPDVYDFNGTKKYNVMVLHKDNTIEMYNLKGQKPSSWKGIHADQTVKSLPERIVVGGSSFWVVRTSIQTVIYPFYGGDPLTVFKGDQMIRPDSGIKVIDGSSVEVSCYDGKLRTVTLK